MSLIQWIALSAVTYRIGRFMILDKIFEAPRTKFHAWLTAHPGRATIYLQTLMLCPYCLTIWISAFASLYWFGLCVDWPGWQWPVWWLATAAGSLLFWHYIDAED